MALTVDYVAKLFENLSTGKTSVFFNSVADDVYWTVMGTHPMAGKYNSKADFLKPPKARFYTEYTTLNGEWASSIPSRITVEQAGALIIDE